jgi:superfamily II DNA/RNA helicase
VAIGITEGLALVAEHDKREALRRLIRTQNVQNALIFCNRKSEVDILHKSLIRHKFDAGALHGDMAQTVRFTTLEKFKAGELRLLVCSDVAARGLDIGGLSHVFNFDVPHHAEDYVHRIGRTGRAGLEGHAFTIAMPEDRLAVEAIEKLTGHPIPPMIVEGLDPVDWAEFDGRKRRGRKAPAKKAPAAKTARGKRAEPGTDRPPRGRDAPARARAETAPRPGDADVTILEVVVPETVDTIQQPRDAIGESDAARPAEGGRASGRRGERGADRSARGERSREPAPRMRPPRDEPRRDEARRDEARRDETRRDETRRDETRRDEARGNEPRRDEPRREAPVPRDRPAAREERPDRWRQNDLGPSVVGFGDDIPAFMMVRRRPMGAPMPEPLPETDA